MVSHLVELEMETTFDSDVCKIMKGDIVMAHGKKEGTLYMTSNFRASISVLFGVRYRSVASKSWAYVREGNEGNALQG